MANRVYIEVSRRKGMTRVEISDNEDRDVFYVDEKLNHHEHAAVLLAVAENSDRGNDILGLAVDVREQSDGVLNHLYINGNNVSVSDYEEGWKNV